MSSDTIDSPSRKRARVESAGAVPSHSPGRDTSQPHVPPTPTAMLPDGSPSVCRVVLTGGPCAGKSTLLSRLKTELTERLSINVYTVPEAATLLVGAGLEWVELNDEKVIEYQLALLRTQIALEDNMTAIARASGKRSLVICDRGTMDGRAYASKEQFEEIMKRGGFTLECLRDERYEAIIHLVTAAEGAEKFYTKANNTARRESPEEARRVCQELRQMYLGHPCLRIVSNRGGFDEKICEARDIIYSVMGAIPPKHETRRFLLVRPPDFSKFKGNTVSVKVTSTVLLGSQSNSVRIVVKREQTRSATYIYHQSADEAIDRVAVRHLIPEREYQTNLAQRDPAHSDVVKQNTCFAYGKGFFDVAVVEEPSWARGLTFMYVEGHESTMPPFVEVDRETTMEPAFSTWALSIPPAAKL